MPALAKLVSRATPVAAVDHRHLMAGLRQVPGRGHAHESRAMTMIFMSPRSCWPALTGFM